MCRRARQEPAPTGPLRLGRAPSAGQHPTPDDFASGITPGGDPKDAVISFYNLMGAGEFRQAAQMWTHHMKAVWDPQSTIDQRFEGTQSTTVESVQLVNRTGHDATVSVTVYDQEKPGSNRSSGTYDLTWFLVKSDSHRLLDNVAS